MWILQLITCGLSLLSISVTAKPFKTNTESSAAYGRRFSVKALTVCGHWDKTCLLHDCDEHVNLEHMQHISKHFNHAINPCEDFHAYACGYWQQQHPKQLTAMAMGEQQLNDKYKQIFLLQSGAMVDTLLKDDLVMQKMHQYLEVCLESESEQPASWKQYILTLRDLGYLHYDNHTNWLKTLRELNLFCNSRFFISLQIDRFNATRYMLFIEPQNLFGIFNFSLDVYEILKMYTNDSYSKLSNDFKHLELDLQNILNTSCPDEYVDCDLTEWLSYEQLLSSNTSVNWEYLLADFPLTLKDQIFLNDLNGLKKIKTYFDQSSQKTLFLYALTHFVHYLQAHSHNIIDKGSDFDSCLRHMRKHFPLAMNYLYEKVFYSSKRAQSDSVIHQILSQLKHQFSLQLDKNEMQLSCDSLQYLKKKLQHLQLNIGNLPKYAAQQFYIDYMSDLKVTHNFYINHLMALQHFFRHQRLLASRSKFEYFWFTFNMHMPNFLDNIDSTAYYFSTANMIILPFAYLQLPFYDYRFWPSLLFGDLANTLGHELIHAFDSKFLEYDYAGNYNEQQSAAILTNRNFNQNVRCLSKEPTQFLDERIADISGTHLALNTFIKDPVFLKQNGKLFFLQFAQFFCGSTNTDDFVLEDASHDLNSIRLNYTLSHMPEFAEVFQCPLATPMNPLEKCKLW